MRADEVQRGADWPDDRHAPARRPANHTGASNLQDPVYRPSEPWWLVPGFSCARHLQAGSAQVPENIHSVRY